MEETYTVELTFYEWIEVVSTIDGKRREYRSNNMSVREHTLTQIREDISKQINNQ